MQHVDEDITVILLLGVSTTWAAALHKGSALPRSSHAPKTANPTPPARARRCPPGRSSRR
jgi:hypothetical protein